MILPPLVFPGKSFLTPDNRKPLNLAQLTKDNVRLVNLSVGSDAVWAVDAAGAVWMRLGPLTPPTDDCVPVWYRRYTPSLFVTDATDE